MSIGERIKKRRKELGMTADDLGMAIGKDRTTVYRYEKGSIEKLPTNVLEPIAEALHTTPAFLMGWEDDPIDYEEWLNNSCYKIPDAFYPDVTDSYERAKLYYLFKQAEQEDYLRDVDRSKTKGTFKNIPLYTSISCGRGMFIDDEIEDYIAIPDKYLTPGVEYFANTAHGDSMIGKGIKDGDVLVFERTSVLENGMIGSFCIDNEKAYCKIYRHLPNGMIMLESANDKYDPIMIDVTNECFRIIGRYKFKFSIEQ